MKFGVHLTKVRVPEWASSYIDYNGLKAHLKIMLQTRSVGNPIDDLEAAFTEFLERELEKVISFRAAKANELTCRVQQNAQIFGNFAKCSIINASEATTPKQKPRLPALITEETDTADMAVDKGKTDISETGREYVSGHVAVGEDGAVIDSSLEEKIIKPVSDDSDDENDDCSLEFDEATAAIMRELDDEISQITCKTSSLSHYSALNSTGFLKILKKHDKHFPGTPLKPRFFARIHSHQPFSSLLHPLIIRLSSLCENVRNSSQILAGELPVPISGVSREQLVLQPVKTTSTQSFVRQTTKYWVHPDNVTEVKLRILRHLPVLVFASKAEYDPEISSVYLDNKSHDLYRGRLQKTDGAQAIRLRWYCRAGNQEIYVERKTHREDWTGEKSIKERFTIKEKHVSDYLIGVFSIESVTRKQVMRGQMSEPDAQRISTLAREIQEEIQRSQVEPNIRTFYNRTAFQLPGDSRVRISLDTELCMVREANELSCIRRPGKAWRRPDLAPANGAWPFVHIHADDICKFPYAVLEVKMQTQLGMEPPGWIVDLVNSNLVVAVPKFSKFVHGCAALFGRDVSLIPYWLPQMDRDIRTATAEGRNAIFDPSAQLEETMQKQPPERQPKETIVDVEGAAGSNPQILQASDGHLQHRIRLNQSPAIALSRGEPANDVWDEREPLLGARQHGETGDHRSNRYARIFSNIWDSVRNQISGGNAMNHGEATRTARGSTAVIAVPVRVEPKVFFANERTFLSWLHFANLIGAVALSLLHFDDKTGRVSGVVFGVVAIFIMAYALAVFIWRARKIRQRDAGPYDDLVGPVFIVAILVAAYFVLLPLKWAHPMI